LKFSAFYLYPPPPPPPSSPFSTMYHEVELSSIGI
jgi:hypothetical protein